jgi:DREV methyltransferase
VPRSVNEGKLEMVNWVKSKNIKTVLDIGAGEGTYANIFRKNNIKLNKIDAIEIWSPYIKKYRLNKKYNNVFINDARNWNDFNYDLIILGDVLEHMTKEEAISLWDKCKSARYAIISIPIIYCPQGTCEGNPYEEHVKDDWSIEEVLSSFNNIVDYKGYETVGVFYAKFE